MPSTLADDKPKQREQFPDCVVRLHIKRGFFRGFDSPPLLGCGRHACCRHHQTSTLGQLFPLLGLWWYSSFSSTGIASWIDAWHLLSALHQTTARAQTPARRSRDRDIIESTSSATNTSAYCAVVTGTRDYAGTLRVLQTRSSDTPCPGSGTHSNATIVPTSSAPVRAGKRLPGLGKILGIQT